MLRSKDQNIHITKAIMWLILNMQQFVKAMYVCHVAKWWISKLVTIKTQTFKFQGHFVNIEYVTVIQGHVCLYLSILACNYFSTVNHITL